MKLFCKFIVKKQFWGYLFIAWLVLIIIGTLYPKIPNLKIENDWFELRLDYIIHFSIYLIMAKLLVLWQYPPSKKFLSRFWLIIIATGIVGAIALEFVQNYIPGRTTNPIDALSNAIGYIIGAFLSVRFFIPARQNCVISNE